MIWKCSYYVIIISIFRFIKFDLQIASVFLNGSCHSLARENVTLSYRIGNDNQWKIIGEYASVGEYDTYVRTHTYIHVSMSVCVHVHACISASKAILLISTHIK